MPVHPFGWLSLLPPIVAIVLAVATRRIVLSLVMGIFAGALLMAGGNPFTAIQQTWETHLWSTLIDASKLRVFSFTIMMGAMIGVITKSGGMQGLINLVSPWASNRRRGQLATWFLGLLIFFDDYANTILLGSTLRPICDKLKISREKLAYLVDSTAAPVAGIALISTWVAVEIDYIASGLDSIPGDQGLSAFGLFLASIPYRFYVWSALFLVPITAILGRDFGPMLQAEQSCVAGKTRLTDSVDEVRGGAGWYHAVLPIAVTLAMVIYFIYDTGCKQASLAAAEAAITMVDSRDGPVIGLRDIVGTADSSLALQYGSLAGLFVAILLPLSTRLMRLDQLINGATSGARVVLPAVAILWCASAMSRMTTDTSAAGDPTTTPYEFKDQRLYTAAYLTQVLAGGEASDSSTAPPYSIEFLPTIVFVLAAVVAFCTGTSWGTMGILVPMVIPLSHALLTRDGAPLAASDPILLGSIAGVLAGAVFGDHCSPISDTTVLSSQSCGCDHLAHVWTQMPYALAAAGVSVGLGTIPIGFGFPVWLALPLQLVALIGIMFLFGRRVECDTPKV